MIEEKEKENEGEKDITKNYDFRSENLFASGPAILCSEFRKYLFAGMHAASIHRIRAHFERLDSLEMHTCLSEVFGWSVSLSL